MISEADARSKILEAVHPLPPRKVSILQALDHFAAEDCFARLPLPNFDNSAMDGYAVLASDCKPGKRLRVTGEQPAGVDRKLHVSNGEAIRIFTGAPMPQGADAVVMQEDVTRDGDEIVVNVDVDLEEFVRKRGCDLGEGQKILAKGERIHATTLALLASQGLAAVLVDGEVRAAIISTGDELATPGQELQPGQIYDSNSLLLQSLLERSGAAVASTQHSSDNADSLRKAFQAAGKNQILIVSGGVWVGEHDLVQSTLRELGAVLVRAVRRVFRLRFAGESSLGVRHVFAVCSPGGFENDGRERSGAAENSGKVDSRSNQRQRSGALSSRETRERKFRANWPAGIARAVRPESVGRALAS